MATEAVDKSMNELDLRRRGAVSLTDGNAIIFKIAAQCFHEHFNGGFLLTGATKCVRSEDGPVIQDSDRSELVRPLLIPADQ
jgi:hypothetical protein